MFLTCSFLELFDIKRHTRAQTNKHTTKTEVRRRDSIPSNRFTLNMT